jgi:hypothetical protein
MQIATPEGRECCTVAALRLQGGAFKTEFKFGFGSGAGIRTLNLAVNSRLLYR